jgi:uncharacterized protein YjbI with pentapeptide repeats
MKIFLCVMECIGSFLVFMVDKICKIIFTLDSLANLFTVIGLPLTIYAVHYAKKAFEKQNEALELQKKDSDEQKILGAWSLLAQKGTGDLGRKDALEFLHSKGKSLAGLDLSNAHLVGLELNGAGLVGAIFEGAHLQEAHFEGATLNFTKFNDATLLKANFEGAQLRKAHFDGAHPTFANFKDAKLQQAHFKSTTLLGTHFNGATLWGANFKDANLQEAHFDGAFLQQAHFEGVDLTYAKFEGAKNIEYAKFENCFVWGSQSLPTTPEGYEFISTGEIKICDRIYCLIKLLHPKDLSKNETKNP